jgi:hypothetical protein
MVDAAFHAPQAKIDQILADDENAPPRQRDTAMQAATGKKSLRRRPTEQVPRLLTAHLLLQENDNKERALKAQGVLCAGRPNSVTQSHTIISKHSVKTSSIDRIIGGQVAPDVLDATPKSSIPLADSVPSTRSLKLAPSGHWPRPADGSARSTRPGRAAWGIRREPFVPSRPFEISRGVSCSTTAFSLRLRRS